jgi:hypothetical protein
MNLKIFLLLVGGQWHEFSLRPTGRKATSAREAQQLLQSGLTAGDVAESLIVRDAVDVVMGEMIVPDYVWREQPEVTGVRPLWRRRVGRWIFTIARDR